MSLPDNSNPAGKPSLARLIDRLSAHAKATREEAAREIFTIGFARATECVSGWLADPEIANCFVFGGQGTGPGFPRTTVGIAVEPGRFAQIRAANGSPRLADVPSDLDAEEFEIRVGDTVSLDVLTTRDSEADGAIARFLRKYGEGIQQVELSVRSVDRATQMLRERFGLAPVYPQARLGANSTRVNFFLVSAPESGKLLVELVEESAQRNF